MQIFPTQYSVLSAAALNNYLGESYGLANSTCRLLIHNVSDTYVIETVTDKYIFKIYRDAHRSIDEIKGEAELLTKLHSKGAKVSYPIAGKNVDMLQAFNAAEGTRYGVMFTWAQGKVEYKMSTAQLQVVGREMAVIHNLTSAIELSYPRKDYNIASTVTDPINKVAPAFEGLEDEYNYLKTTAAEVTAYLEQIPGSFSYGYCQFDFLPKNFHFADDGDVTFFDFDFAGKGWLAYDVTSFFVHYFIEVALGKITEAEGRAAFKVFVESYREVRPLSDAELQAIPYLGFGFWVFYLGFQYDNFDDWSNFFFGPKFLKERTAAIKKWMEEAHKLL